MLFQKLLVIYFFLLKYSSVAQDGHPAAESLWKKHLRITTTLDPPFNFEKNGFFRGFIPDLIRLILQDLNATYELYAVGDGKYGAIDADGKWNGLVGEVLTGKADIAMAPLTITWTRNQVVKFSFPFMPANIIPVMKKPSNPKQPLPFETILEMNQLADRGLLKLGVADEGATLSMFRNSKYPLYSEIYNNIIRDNATGHQPFLNSYEEAVSRVREEQNLVFLGEDAALDYLSGRLPCDLVTWGHKPLNTAFYGFAYQKSVPDTLVDYINSRLIFLQRSGEMKFLKEKWWANECKMYKRCHCKEHVDRGLNSTPKNQSGESNESFAPEAVKNFEG